MKTKDCNLSRLNPKKEKLCGTCVEDSSEMHISVPYTENPTMYEFDLGQGGPGCCFKCVTR